MPRYRRANPYFWVGQPKSAQNVVPAAAGLACASTQAASIFGFSLQNRTGGNVNCALIGLLPDSAWYAGQWTNVGTVFTDDTADSQSGTSNAFALQTVTNSDGHLVGALYPFGCLGYDVTTAGIGAGTVSVLEYWNGAWTAIAAAGTLKDIPRTAGQNWALNENLVLFDPPADWVVGGTGTNVKAGYYNLRYRATTAATTAALAARLYVGVVIESYNTVATLVEKQSNWAGKVSLNPGIVAIGSAWSVVNGLNAIAVNY